MSWHLDKVKEELKETEVKLAASTDELLVLKVLLEQSNEKLKHREAELEEFKSVSAFFLSDFVTEVDSIMPDDLEYGLAKFEESVAESIAEIITNQGGLNQEGLVNQELSWIGIYNLCKQLGCTHTSGYTPLQDAKIFLKTLVRVNTLLEKENIKLSGLIKIHEKDITG